MEFSGDGGGAEASLIGVAAFSAGRLYGDWRELAFRLVGVGGIWPVACSNGVAE